jgi:hypothetical protein
MKLLSIASILCIIPIFAYRVFRDTYLKKEQWNSISHLLQHKGLTHDMRNKINKILYYHYDDWSYLKATDFKYFHRHKCRHIKMNELYLYANRGLMKGIMNYKPIGAENEQMRFLKYVTFYIKGELYKGLTELMPLSPVSKYIRMHKNDKGSHLQAEFLGSNDWVLDNAINNYGRHTEYHNQLLIKNSECSPYKDYWVKINQLEPFAMRILHYKYNYRFDTIRSNKQVAELMVCSDETVRKSIHSSFHKIFYKSLFA